MNQYNVIIVGAGTAGAVTAQHIHNKSVALFERRSQPASVCAGGLNSSWLDSIYKLDDYVLPTKAIQIPIKSARINTPNSSFILNAGMINQQQLGYIVDRSVFDKDLLDRALRNNSCDYHPSEKVIDCKQNDCVFTITTEKGIYTAPIVVDATGAQASIGSKLGLPVELPDWCMHTAIQYVVDLPVGKKPYEIEFWFDAEKIPTGYVWSFPCGNDKAKLGVGIDRVFNHPKKILDQFIRDHPEWSLDNVYERSAGLIPTGKMVFSTISDCYLVGDAGRFCITALDYILTDNGWKYAFRIKENDNIISFNLEKKIFEPDTIKKVFKRYSQENEIVRIYTDEGIIDLTEDHILPIIRKDLEWVKAVDLRENDMLFGYPNTPPKYKIPANIKISTTISNLYITDPTYRTRVSEGTSEAMEKVMSDPIKRERVLQGLEYGRKISWKGITWEERFGVKNANERRRKQSEVFERLREEGKLFDGSKLTAEAKILIGIKSKEYGKEHWKERAEKIRKGYNKWVNTPEAKEVQKNVNEKLLKWRRAHPIESYQSSLRGAITNRRRNANFRERRTIGETILDSAVNEIYGSLVEREYPIFDKYGKFISIIDIAVPKLELAFFSDGEYWHNYPYGTERDKRVNKTLKNLRWKIFRFWEKDLIKGNFEIPILADDPKVIKIERLNKRFWVYDFEVERNHTLVVNGIVLHNCSPLTGGGIYGAYVSGYYAGKCITADMWNEFKPAVLSSDIGSRLRKHWIGKKFFYTMSNEMLDKLCSVAVDYEPETANLDKEVFPLIRHLIDHRALGAIMENIVRYLLFSFAQKR